MNVRKIKTCRRFLCNSLRVVIVLAMATLSSVASGHNEAQVLEAFKQARSGVVGIYSFSKSEKDSIDVLGSGFFFTENCYIITNQHIVADSQRVGVSVEGSAKGFKADILARSERLDIAILKIEGLNKCNHLTMAQSSDVAVGKSVFALGHPIGLDVTITGGMISALNRSFVSHSSDLYHRLIQTDVAIFPGNSGGPIINLQGKVIGVNTFKTKYGTGLSFAIPISIIQPLMPELLKNKKLQTRSLGIQAEQNEKKNIQKLDDYVNGILVKEVFKASHAEKAGLLKGDLIINSNGKALKSINDLEMELYSYPLGSKIRLEVIRDSQSVFASIPVAAK